MFTTRKRQWFSGLAIAMTMLFASAVALAQGQAQRDATPDEFDDIEIVQRHDNQVPVDARFLDHNGEPVQIGRYFDGTLPVVLVPVYYGCPQLCGLTLNSFVDTLRQMEWELGKDFRVVTVSFDHTEMPALANAKRNAYLREYGRPLAREDGWVFLTGDEEQIRRVTESVGFGFRWNPTRDEYAHKAALIILTPQGHVSEYMGGVLYDPVVLRRLLVSASEGEVGSIFDQVFLFCFHFDSTRGVYTAQALRIMQVGAVLTLALLAAFLVPLWIRSAFRRGGHGPASDPLAEGVGQPTDSTSDDATAAAPMAGDSSSSSSAAADEFRSGQG